VPTKDLLIAMKVHSGRDVDMRDIVMLSEGVSWNVIARHLARGEKDVLVKQLTQFITRMKEEQFAQSLRATFGPRRAIEPLISKCGRNLSKLRASIESSGR
jgi:hypothetical protein